MLKPTPESLRRVPLYADLDDATLANVIGEATVVDLRPGDSLWLAGGRTIGFVALLEGAVKLAQPLVSGKLATLAFIGAPESVGDVPTFFDLQYPACCYALTRGRALRMPREFIMSLADEHPLMRRKLEQTPLLHLRRLQKTIAMLHAGTVPARLASLLLELADGMGRTCDDGTIVPIPLTRQELADMIASRVESVIRVMRAWQVEGVVESRDDGFLIRRRNGLEKVLRQNED